MKLPLFQAHAPDAVATAIKVQDFALDTFLIPALDAGDMLAVSLGFLKTT